jgi:ketosteroid isomerase-like protein
MSENLDLVRSIFAAWERGDYDRTDWADPEIEWIIVDGPTPGVWRGTRGMEQTWRDWLSAWEVYRTRVEECCELDDGRLLVLTLRSGYGKTSGFNLGEVGTTGASVVSVRDGKVTRLVNYWDRDRALADLGLEQ